MSKTQLIYCSKQKAQVSNEKDGTFFNVVDQGVVVNEGDEVSIEQVCINSTGIGNDVIEIPLNISNYSYDPSLMQLNTAFYLNYNFRYSCMLPLKQFTVPNMLINTITTADYGYASDLYILPPLTVVAAFKTSYQTDNINIQKITGRRCYVGAWWSDPSRLKEVIGVPPKSVAGARTFPTQKGHCFSLLEADIQFGVDNGYDSPSNIAEVITTDFHAAKPSKQNQTNSSENYLIQAEPATNEVGGFPQLAVSSNNTCSVIISGFPQQYINPAGYNFYGSFFSTTNPYYLVWGSRLLSQYITDGGSGPKGLTYINSWLPAVPNPPHANDIYSLFDLPVNPAVPANTLVPDGLLFVSNLLWNESSLDLVQKFLLTQGSLVNTATPLTTNDLDDVYKSRFSMFLNVGRNQDNNAGAGVPLPSPIMDQAITPSIVNNDLSIRTKYKLEDWDKIVYPAAFINDGWIVDTEFLITYKGVDITAGNLAQQLGVQILCCNYLGERYIAFQMLPATLVGTLVKRGNYALVDLGMYNPMCLQAIVINPELNAGTFTPVPDGTRLQDYSKKLQLGAPNMNMAFDGVRSRFGIGNMSWPRMLSNDPTVATPIPSAGLKCISTNHMPDNVDFGKNSTGLDTLPYTNYSQSGIGIQGVSVADKDGNFIRIDEYNPLDIQDKYSNSLLRRLGFTYRQLVNLNGIPVAWFSQTSYETGNKRITFANSFPYPMTNNLRFDTALNEGLSSSKFSLPMFNLETQRGIRNINIEAEHDTSFALELPIKLVTPFYLIKSDIFEGNIAFNSENDGATESIMLCCNKAYTSGDYAYSFGTSYSFKATKSFVISGIKTAVLKPDLTPAEIDGGTSVIYKVVSPIPFFEEQQQEEQILQKKQQQKQPTK